MKPSPGCRDVLSLVTLAWAAFGRWNNEKPMNFQKKMLQCTKNLAFHFHPIVQISRGVPKAVKICFRTTPTSAGCYQALPTTLAALPGTKIDLKYRCPGVPRSSTMLGKCFIFHGHFMGRAMGISGTGTPFWGLKAS